MALSDDDVREILRLIDDAELDELRIETEGLSLHVVRGGSAPAVEPVAARPEQDGTRRHPRLPRSRRRRPDDRGADDRRLLPRAEPRRAALRRRRDTRRGRHHRLPDRGDEDDELGARGRRGHDRGDPRRERERRSSTVSRCSAWSRHDAGAGRPVEIVDTTTRDGNQSLWGATGLTARETLAIAPVMERVGFHALDFTSSTHMSVSVRFHREDPWELIRLMRAATPDHAPQLHHHRHALHRVAAVRRGRDAARVQVRRAQRDPPLPVRGARQRPGALRRSARIAREEGVEEIVVGLTYSISPVHTHAYYAERVAALADCGDIDRFYLKDPGGLLTTDAVRELGPALRGDRPHGRAAQPLHHRARADRLHGGPAGRLRRAPHGGGACRQRNLSADRRVDLAQSRGRGVRARARHRAARARVGVLPSSS